MDEVERYANVGFGDELIWVFKATTNYPPEGNDHLISFLN